MGLIGDTRVTDMQDNQKTIPTKRTHPQAPEPDNPKTADFLRQFADVRNGTEQALRAAHRPIAKREITYRFRHVAINRYNENIMEMEKAIRQGPTKHCSALTRKLHRCINGHHIDGIIEVGS